jgi:hypothetical protein
MYGISGVRKRAMKTEELNNLRQVYLAWNLYANNNNSAALPGYLAIDVQQRWKLHYEFPDKTDIPPAPNYNLASPNIAGPWVWRLMPYLDNNHDVVHGYTGEDDVFAESLIAEAQEFAEEPGFGYNGYYIGGYWEMVDVGGQPTPRARFFPQDAVLNGALPAGERPLSVPMTVSQVNKSDKFIIFCASSKFTMGVYPKPLNDRPGDYMVIPPYLADEPQWTSGVGADFGGSGQTANAEQSASPFVLNVLTETSAPLCRYTNQAALVHADGNTTSTTPGGLMDMRFWVNSAEKANSTHSP